MPLPGHLGRLPAAVQARLRAAVEAGTLGPADIDPYVIDKLNGLPEAAALICVTRFLAADLCCVANKTGFLVGIISRLRREAPGALKGGAAPLPVAIAAGHGDPSRTLYVGNLPLGAGEAELRAVFGCVGALRDLRVCGPDFAFVEYADADAATAAHALDGTRLGENRLAVRRADPRQSDAASARGAALGAAARASTAAIAPLVQSRTDAVGGVSGPRQLAALAAITSPAAAAALGAAAHPAAPAVWGMCRRHSPGDSDDNASASRSRSPRVRDRARGRSPRRGSRQRDDRSVSPARRRTGSRNNSSPGRRRHGGHVRGRDDDRRRDGLRRDEQGRQVYRRLGR